MVSHISRHKEAFENCYRECKILNSNDWRMVSNQSWDCQLHHHRHNQYFIKFVCNDNFEVLIFLVSCCYYCIISVNITINPIY